MADELISTNSDEIGDFWANAVYPYIKPIVEANEQSEPSPIGTAVLVTFGPQQYLLTAGHVIAPHLEGGPKEQAKGAPYCYLPEQVDIVGPVDIADDPVDLALVIIPTGPRHCLRMPQHLARGVHNGELCLFLGFQAREKSWMIDHSQHTLRPRPLSYLGHICNVSALRFSVKFNQKQLYRGGVKQNAVGKLNGISGSGVFVLRNDAPKLAGIIIEYHALRSEVVATSSLAVWEMLRATGRPT